MKRLLLAAATMAVLAACEPEYEETAGHEDVTGAEAHGAAPEHALEVTGGADSAGVSGRVPADSGGTIHHPGADGNSGRPPDLRTAEAASGGPGGA